MPARNPPVLVGPLCSIVLAIVLAAGGALFMAARSAHAEMEGPCSATIAGADIGGLNSGNRNDDIEVSQDDAVVVAAAAAAGFESHKIQLEFAGRRWTISDEDDDGSPTWSGSVNVDDYATYGVGLYKVIGVSTLTDGSTCTGAATVDVGGNPLTTVAGAGAAGAAVIGTVGAVASAGRGAWNPFGTLEDTLAAGDMVGMVEESFDEAEASAERAEQEREERIDRGFGRLATFIDIACACTALLAVFLVPLMAISGGGGAPGEPSRPEGPSEGQSRRPPRRLPRVPWRLRITLLGLIGGFLAGVGAVVLMQQYSIEYPTLAVILRTVLVIMAVYGIVLPTLGSTIGWLRVNRRIAAREGGS